MAYEILTESYGRRLPKITATADSTDDLATLGTNWAEGSTCVISDTTYKLDKVGGWVDPSSGGGSSLPSVTSDDNGDVLTVVEGAWAKSDPPSSLPSVTSDDNGDVLTVVEGAWAKAAPSGGGGALMITITETRDGADRTLTMDKTYSEIKAAASAGSTIIGHFSHGANDGDYCVFMGLAEDSAGGEFTSAYIYMTDPRQNAPLTGYYADSADGYPYYYQGD